jgi:hypothetical protein
MKAKRIVDNGKLFEGYWDDNVFVATAWHGWLR